MERTDPAKELAELCTELSRRNNRHRGVEVLAAAFEVPAWSAEFYQMVFTVLRRADDLDELLSSIDMEEDLRLEASNHLSQIKRAFSEEGLNNTWSHSTANFISPEHISAVRMASLAVRQVQSYPKLSDEDRVELIQAVDELLSWLRKHQLSEQDFIRQSIIDGLESFKFRVQRVRWLGWGYTLTSLKDVIGAYLALDRGIDPAAAPDASALLLKVAAGLKKIYARAGMAKDVVETGQFLLEAYKWTSTVAVTGKLLLLSGSSS